MTSFGSRFLGLLLAYTVACGLFSAAGFLSVQADDSAPPPGNQSKNQIENQGTSAPPPDTHIVGVKPIQAGPPAQSSGELGSGNSPAMGLGIQIDLFRPRSAPVAKPSPTAAPPENSENPGSPESTGN